MEIIAESTLWFEYIFVLFTTGMIIIICVLGFIGGLAAIFDRTFYKNFSDYMMTAAALLLTVLFSAIFYGGIKAGPTIQYKAIVTDFNEVYSQGYEIVGREGDMFILRKMDEEE